MPTLYVTEPGAVVRKSASSLVITLNDDPDGKGPLPEKRKILLEVEPHRLELVALVGRVHITSNATISCLEQGISVAWFTRSGRYLGRLQPEMPRSADLRFLQYRAASDKAMRLGLARVIVSAKISNAAEVLADIQGNDPANEALRLGISDLRSTAERSLCAESGEALLGIEGSGARVYYETLSSAFKADIGFSERKKRPPPDPANSLMSFGYVLLGNLLAGTLEARGLDPAMGFYHRVRPGRPSLALDLLEELRRPIVDRFVLRSCNLRIFRPKMFEARDPNEGIRLKREALGTFFREWEKALSKPLREKGVEHRLDAMGVIRRQVDRLALHFRGKDTYLPFQYGG